MSLMIVAIHTHAFEDIGVINDITSPLLSSAVPIFFILSSFFLFRKLETTSYTWNQYKPFIKRILVLYIFWFIVTLPITIHTKYSSYDVIGGISMIIKDFLFSQTFQGSWFLTALVFGTFVIFCLKKYIGISNLGLLLTSILLYIYIHEYSLLPQWMQTPYWFVHNHISQAVELTPITGYIWVSLGCILAKGNLLDLITRHLGVTGGAISFIITYVLRVLLPHDFQYLLVPFLVLSIITLAYIVKFEPRNYYLTLRKLSILLYLIHFPVLYVTIILPYETLNIVYYLVVLSLSLITAGGILKLENYEVFKFLKYSH